MKDSGKDVCPYENSQVRIRREDRMLDAEGRENLSSAEVYPDDKSVSISV